MQVPLLHRSTQMALLKKQIRRKARELRQRKRRARRRLEVMCRIRDQLLQRMRQSIGLRQRDAELERRERARRAVGGMLAMYKHWLGNWSRALRLQNRLIRQQEQLKKRLHRRLHHLRKRLKKRRNPHRLVDKCFRRLAKAIRKWQSSPQYHQFIEGQDQIWEAEAQEVRKYLSDIHGKRRRKHRRTRAGQDNDIEDFATFWNNEVLRKNTKAKKRTRPEIPVFKEELKYTPYKIPKAIRFKKKAKAKPKIIHISLDDLLIQKQLQRKMKKIRRLRTPDPTKPSFDELKLLVKELTEFHSPNKEKRASNSSPKAPKKKRKHIKRSPIMSDISIFSESRVFQPQFQRKAKKANPLNLKKLLKMDNAPQPKVLKTKLLSAKKSRKHKLWKRKNNYVDLVIRDELRALFDQNKHFKHPKQSHSHPGKTKAVATGSEQLKKRSSWKQSVKTRRPKLMKKSSYGKQRTLVHRLLSDLSTVIKHRRHIKKQARSIRGFSSSSSGSIISKEVLIDKSSRSSDAATEVMVRRLKKRPRPEAETSVSPIAEARDSITSLSESLNKIIMANRSRKSSMRKSFRGPLIMPKKIVVAPSKGREESHYQSLKKNMMYIPTGVSQPVRPRKWKSFSSRKSISVPLLTSQREPKPFPQKSVSDTILSRMRTTSGLIIGGNIQDFGRTIDTSIPQASIQIDENRNRSVTLDAADSADHSSPSSVSKTRIQQLREFHYEALPEELDKMDPTQIREYYERMVRASEEVHDSEAMEPMGHTEPRSTGPNRFLMKDLESDAKHKPLQMFLRDVIEKNKFIDYVTDVKRFMLMVGRHPMWDSLQLLHDELSRTGFSKDEIKQMLSARYLEYLNGVATEMHFAKIEQPRDVFLNLVDTEPVPEPVARKLSQVDRLMSKSSRESQRHSQRHSTRLSTRLIPFGKRGSRSTTPYSHRSSQEARLDGPLYKKLIEQELKAAALEREDRKRRLFPTFSRIFGTYGSSVSLAPSLDMAPSEEQDLRDSETRYSLQNLRSVLNDHKQMFKAFNRRRFTEEIVQKELEGRREEMLSTTQFRRPKEKPTTFTLRKRKRKLRPIEDLYYAPRKTCRMQKFTEGSECSDCECQEEQPGDSMVLKKCPRCGVKVPVPAASPSFHYISPTSSSEVLSSGSIEACVKNKLLVGTLADICTRCGYIHDKGDPCSQLPQNTRKSKLLKRIQDSVRIAPECPVFCSPRGILKKPRNFDP